MQLTGCIESVSRRKPSISVLNFDTCLNQSEATKEIKVTKFGVTGAGVGGCGMRQYSHAHAMARVL
eukprot:2247357-Pyramimonas_sp.AAC.2